MVHMHAGCPENAQWLDRLTAQPLVEVARSMLGPRLAKIPVTAFADARLLSMKPIKTLLVLAILCAAPALASAQRYYRGRGPAAAPAPGGFHNRTGRLTFGGGIGLGGMWDGGS